MERAEKIYFYAVRFYGKYFPVRSVGYAYKLFVVVRHCLGHRFVYHARHFGSQARSCRIAHERIELSVQIQDGRKRRQKNAKNGYKQLFALFAFPERTFGNNKNHPALLKFYAKRGDFVICFCKEEIRQAR